MGEAATGWLIRYKIKKHIFNTLPTHSHKKTCYIIFAFSIYLLFYQTLIKSRFNSTKTKITILSSSLIYHHTILSIREFLPCAGKFPSGGNFSPAAGNFVPASAEVRASPVYASMAARWVSSCASPQWWRRPRRRARARDFGAPSRTCAPGGGTPPTGRSRVTREAVPWPTTRPSRSGTPATTAKVGGVRSTECPACYPQCHDNEVCTLIRP